MLVGFTVLKMDIPHSGLTVLTGSFVLVTIRRKYLGMKPWWGAPLLDIPKYFEKP